MYDGPSMVGEQLYQLGIEKKQRGIVLRDSANRLFGLSQTAPENAFLLNCDSTSIETFHDTGRKAIIEVTDKSDSPKQNFRFKATRGDVIDGSPITVSFSWGEKGRFRKRYESMVMCKLTSDNGLLRPELDYNISDAGIGDTELGAMAVLIEAVGRVSSLLTLRIEEHNTRMIQRGEEVLAIFNAGVDLLGPKN